MLDAKSQRIMCCKCNNRKYFKAKKNTYKTVVDFSCFLVPNTDSHSMVESVKYGSLTRVCATVVYSAFHCN